MVLYLLIFTMISFMAYFETYVVEDDESERFRLVMTIIVILFLSLVSGTRLLGGSDYYLYKAGYDAVPKMPAAFSKVIPINNDIHVRGFDLGYLYITSFFKTLGFSYHGFCLIHSLFFNFSLYFGLKKYCKKFFIVLLVYISKIFFYDTFISMRQSITIAIFFLSLELIRKRKIIPYFIICLLCLTIHTGSIIMIPAYFITYVKLTKKRVLLFVLLFLPFGIMNILHISYLSGLVSLANGILGGTSVGDKITNYSAAGDNLSPIYLFEFLLLAILVIKNFDQLIEYNSENSFIIPMFLILWVLFTFFGSFSVITREKDYFILTYAFLLSDLVSINKNSRMILMAAMIGICGFEFFRYISLFDGGSLKNYSSWLINTIAKY